MGRDHDPDLLGRVGEALMSERMHPEDARRELVMEFYKIATLSPALETRDECITWAIDSAEKLLAELKRTAKPDPNTVMLPIPKAATNVRYVLAGKEYEVGGPCNPKPEPRAFGECPQYVPDDGGMRIELPEGAIGARIYRDDKFLGFFPAVTEKPESEPAQDVKIPDGAVAITYDGGKTWLAIPDKDALGAAITRAEKAEACADFLKGRAERAEMALDAIAQVINGATKPVLPTELVKQVVMLMGRVKELEERIKRPTDSQGRIIYKGMVRGIWDVIEELETELGWMKEHKAEGEKWQGASNLRIQELEAELETCNAFRRDHLEANQQMMARLSQQYTEIVELKAHLSAADLALRKVANVR